VLASLLPGLREIRTRLAVGYAWLFAGYLAIGHNFPKPGQAAGVLADVYDLARLVTPAGVAIVASVLAYLIGIVASQRFSLSRPALPLWAKAVAESLPKPWRVTSALDSLVVERLADRLGEDADFRASVVKRTVDSGQSAGMVMDAQLLDELLCKEPHVRQDAVRHLLETARLAEQIRGDLPLVAERMRAQEDPAAAEHDRLRAEADFRAGMAVPLLAFVVTIAARGSLWWLPTLAAPVLLYRAALAARRDAQLLLISALAARRYDDRLAQLLDNVSLAQVLRRDDRPEIGWAAPAVRVVRSLAVSPDATVVAGGTADGQIHLWDTATGDLIRSLAAHRLDVTSLAFSPDGELLISGGEDRCTRVWEVETGVERQRLEHDEAVVDVAVNRDGVFVIGTRSSLTWWYSDDQRPSRVALGSHWLDHMALDPDSKLLAVALDDGTLRVYVGEIPVDLATYEDLTLVGWSGLNPFVVGFTKTADDVELRSWDPLTGKDIHPAAMVGRDLTRPTLARPQGAWLAVADEEDHVLLLDVQTGEVTKTLAGHRDSVAALAWSSAGDLLASSATDGTVIVWDVADGRSRLRLVPPRAAAE
jgi:WD domain, G-beta repeat